jgi:hypothetical protein
MGRLLSHQAGFKAQWSEYRQESLTLRDTEPARLREYETTTGAMRQVCKQRIRMRKAHPAKSQNSFQRELLSHLNRM